MSIAIRDIIDPAIAYTSGIAAESLAMVNMIAGALADSGAFGLYLNPNNPVDSSKCVAAESDLPETAASGTIYCVRDTRKFYQYSSSGREEIQNGIIICTEYAIAGNNADYYMAMIIVNGVLCAALGISTIVTNSSSYKYANGVKVYSFYANGVSYYTYNKSPVNSDFGTPKSYYKAAITSNGVMFGISQWRTNATVAPSITGSIIVAKSNGDYPIVICGCGVYSNSTTPALVRSGSVFVCSYEDTSYLLTNTNTSNATADIYRYNASAGQSILVPFAAYGRSNEKSFSPYAFWKSVSGEYTQGYKKVHVGDKNYVTDGWWLLRDL